MLFALSLMSFFVFVFCLLACLLCCSLVAPSGISFGGETFDGLDKSDMNIEVHTGPSFLASAFYFFRCFFPENPFFSLFSWSLGPYFNSSTHFSSAQGCRRMIGILDYCTLLSSARQSGSWTLANLHFGNACIDWFSRSLSDVLSKFGTPDAPLVDFSTLNANACLVQATLYLNQFLWIALRMCENDPSVVHHFAVKDWLEPLLKLALAPPCPPQASVSSSPITQMLASRLLRIILPHVSTTDAALPLPDETRLVNATAFLTHLLHDVGKASLPSLHGSPANRPSKEYNSSRLSELCYLYRALLNSVPFNPTALAVRAAAQAAALAAQENSDAPPPPSLTREVSAVQLGEWSLAAFNVLQSALVMAPFVLKDIDQIAGQFEAAGHPFDFLNPAHLPPALALQLGLALGALSVLGGHLETIREGCRVYVIRDKVSGTVLSISSSGPDAGTERDDESVDPTEVNISLRLSDGSCTSLIGLEKVRAEDDVPVPSDALSSGDVKSLVRAFSELLPLLIAPPSALALSRVPTAAPLAFHLQRMTLTCCHRLAQCETFTTCFLSESALLASIGQQPHLALIYLTLLLLSPCPP